MNNSYNNINTEKLNNTLKIIKSINNSIESNDISKYFLDIDNTLKKINFEHGNCISNYKDEINSILDILTTLKQNINSLENSLSITISDFSTIEHRETIGNNNSTSITQIPPATTEPTENQIQESTQTNDGINTVPIGLGIAATGIAGSVGAIIVDSMKNKENANFKTSEDIVEKYEEQESETSNPTIIQSEETIFQDAEPYQASRNSEIKNKFYGTDTTEYYEKEDEES